MIIEDNDNITIEDEDKTNIRKLRRKKLEIEKNEIY